MEISFNYPNSNLKASEIKAPAFTAPDISVPDIKLPKFSAPSFTVPKFETPNFDVPNFDAPKTEAPKTAAPKFEAPSFKAPEVPSLALPKISLPAAAPAEPKNEVPLVPQETRDGNARVANSNFKNLDEKAKVWNASCIIINFFHSIYFTGLQSSIINSTRYRKLRIRRRLLVK